MQKGNLFFELYFDESQKEYVKLKSSKPVFIENVVKGLFQNIFASTVQAGMEGSKHKILYKRLEELTDTTSSSIDLHIASLKDYLQTDDGIQELIEIFDKKLSNEEQLANSAFKEAVIAKEIEQLISILTKDKSIIKHFPEPFFRQDIEFNFKIGFYTDMENTLGLYKFLRAIVFLDNNYDSNLDELSKGECKAIAYASNLLNDQPVDPNIDSISLFTYLEEVIRKYNQQDENNLNMERKVIDLAEKSLGVLNLLSARSLRAQDNNPVSFDRAGMTMFAHFYIQGPRAKAHIPIDVESDDIPVIATFCPALPVGAITEIFNLFNSIARKIST